MEQVFWIEQMTNQPDPIQAAIDDATDLLQQIRCFLSGHVAKEKRKKLETDYTKMVDGLFFGTIKIAKTIEQLRAQQSAQVWRHEDEYHEDMGDVPFVFITDNGDLYKLDYTSTIACDFPCIEGVTGYFIQIPSANQAFEKHAATIKAAGGE